MRIEFWANQVSVWDHETHHVNGDDLEEREKEIQLSVGKARQLHGFDEQRKV